MIILLIVGCVIAAMGALLGVVSLVVACMQDKGRRCVFTPPHPVVILALDLRGLLRPAAPLPARAPVVTDAEVREEFERLAPSSALPPLRDCCMALENEPHTSACPARQPVPMSPDPAQAPFTGWRVPDGWQLPGGRGLMFTRTPWPSAADPIVPLETDDDPPWDVATRQQPAIDEPAYGVDRCEADVDEARRQSQELIA